MRKYLPPLILFFLLLIGWQALALGINAAYILPTPIQVIQKLWELREPLFMVHLPATMSVTFIGLGISVVLGLALAIAMDMHEGIRRTLYPLVIASQTIPTTAIAPLFVLWFGYSIWSKVLVTVLMTFFPITITVYDGFQSTKRPNALPYFFSAIKMAIPISIIGAAIGEWLGAQSGLGYFSKRMLTQLDGAGVFAPIVLLSAVAMLIVAIVGIIERIAIPWRKEL